MPYNYAAKLRLCHEFAAKRGGECLSTVYTNSRTKVHWRCAAGHGFEMFMHLVGHGRWCPRCANRGQLPDTLRRERLEEVRALAATRGGACESAVYISEKHALEWRCVFGHRWEAPAGNVRRRAWCPYCSGHRLTIADMQALIEKVGGTCLSERYIDMDAKLLWRCASGHEWMASSTQIRRSALCPTCSPGPTYQTYELDGLHELARRRGGVCLAAHRIKNGGIKVPWQCGAGHTWRATPYMVRSGSWCLQCHRQADRGRLSHVQKLARYNGGECLSTEYVNAATNLRWRCATGHEWEATPSNVTLGHWCPECTRGTSRRTPLTLADIQAAVADRGRCRSRVYVNAKTKLRFECLRGHQWDARPTHVLRGLWCPYCAGLVKETRTSMRRSPKRSGPATRTNVARPCP